MKKLLVWGYALQSMDKAEKMGLPRVSSGAVGISEKFNPKKTHPDFDFPWSWFVKGQEIPKMPEKVYVCLKKQGVLLLIFCHIVTSLLCQRVFWNLLKNTGLTIILA
ncbi:hypothetical protein [Neisseria sp. HMSC058F07]|uniref:hypothetical protein n=1 Tax=Neisseria sp. HMSC058F07 TaxID=1715175 RepID=UPI000AE77DCE|nr:hypothetical protein [Neisseria sp. HMSC058F07]